MLTCALAPSAGHMNPSAETRRSSQNLQQPAPGVRSSAPSAGTRSLTCFSQTLFSRQLSTISTCLVYLSMFTLTIEHPVKIVNNLNPPLYTFNKVNPTSFVVEILMRMDPLKRKFHRTLLSFNLNY
jgi:hypothetical protein